MTISRRETEQNQECPGPGLNGRHADFQSESEDRSRNGSGSLPSDDPERNKGAPKRRPMTLGPYRHGRNLRLMHYLSDGTVRYEIVGRFYGPWKQHARARPVREVKQPAPRKSLAYRAESAAHKAIIERLVNEGATKGEFPAAVRALGFETSVRPDAWAVDSKNRTADAYEVVVWHPLKVDKLKLYIELYDAMKAASWKLRLHRIETDNVDVRIF